MAETRQAWRRNLIGAIVAFVLVVTIWVPQLLRLIGLRLTGGRLTSAIVHELNVTAVVTLPFYLVAMVLLWRAYYIKP